MIASDLGSILNHEYLSASSLTVVKKGCPIGSRVDPMNSTERRSNAGIINPSAVVQSYIMAIFLVIVAEKGLIYSKRLGLFLCGTKAYLFCRNQFPTLPNNRARNASVGDSIALRLAIYAMLILLNGRDPKANTERRAEADNRAIYQNRKERMERLRYHT